MRLFTDTGLNEAMMDEWHRLYETRHAASHQRFLEWLGLPENQIAEIRNRYR